MRLSDTLGDPKDLTVQFKRGVLNVKYLPMRYTPAEIDKLQDEAQDSKAGAKRIAALASELLVSWDLTEEVPGEPVDGFTKMEERVIQTDAETLYQKVPVDVLTAVIRAAQKDQSSGEDDAN